MKPTPRAERVEVGLGSEDTPIGHLSYAKHGNREYSSFGYCSAWLENPERYALSPDLPMVAGFQMRRAPTGSDSVFHHALADTAPDAWGRRVIARAHAKARQAQPSLKALTELDYLCAVDDFSRVGAIRLHRNAAAQPAEPRRTPPLIELERIFFASRALERGVETAEDLRYLQGKGTSLGGMRPKCTVLDEHGKLAIGKFPSQADERSVTRGEVLALTLARRAGIEAAKARIVDLQGVPVAVIERFDRTGPVTRIPYLSAASMLQASRDEDRSYTEIADAIRAQCEAPTADVRQLWRRMVFNHLITNVDDHLQNHGFLYVGRGQWRLSPAFDINPFPDKDRESKTWLTQESGPISSIHELLRNAAYFGFGSPDAAKAVLAEILHAVTKWRTVAMSAEVGMSKRDLDDFAPAFEHPAVEQAEASLNQ